MTWVTAGMRSAHISLLFSTSVFVLMSVAAPAQEGRRLVIPLEGDSISLSAGLAPELEARIAKKVKQSHDLTGRPHARVPLLVSSSDPAATLAALHEYGLSPTEKLNHDAFIILGGPDELKILARSPGVRAVDLLPAAAKISRGVKQGETFAWHKRDGVALAYSVRVYPGTDAKEIEALLRTDLVQALENYDSASVAIVGVFTAVMDPSHVHHVAELPFVAAIDMAPPPDIPDNEDSTQPLSNVDDVQLPPYNLSGAGVNVGVWEATEGATMGFGLLSTHQSLSGRVTVEEASNASNHATHVAGTIASDGTTAGTEGMAPAAGLASYGAANDANEMTLAKNSAGGAGDPLPISISNHSYGIGIGWSGNGTQFQSPNAFGQYTMASVAFDNVVVNTDLIVAKSAGNHRNDQWNGVSADPSIPAPVPPRDCRQGGLGVDADCISPRGTAKNILTVGAMTPAGAIAGFSGFGPTDDGRIKPDLVANGTQVTSTGASSVIASYPSQGTSMSTPAVSGIAALLLEEANNHGLALSAAGAKAVLLQTAQDVAATGQAQPGPDYATGWGIADAQAAVDLLRRPAGAGLAQETLLAAGAAGAYTQAFVVDAGEPELKVTLAWTDPAGSTIAPQNVPRLVNDLDLRLLDPNGAPVTPWSLNPANPGAAAIRDGGDDTRNNVEQVSVLNPAAGIWQAQVTAKPSSFSGPQDFALAGPLSPASGPFAATPTDVMMVLDGSGSMNGWSATPSVSKLEALKSAAEEVANFLEIVGGHQLGIVRFSSSAGATSPAFNLQPINAGSIANAENAINGLTAGGMTNIIDGVQQAVGQLAGASAANARQAVILFSDGRHNTPGGSDVASIDAILSDPTLFYGIGFGTDVDSTVMPIVAANHNGIYLEEQTLTAAELSKLFITVGGLVIDETIIVDPDHLIQPGGLAWQPVVVGPDDRSITFATHWNTPNPKQFSFRLFGPGQRCVITENGAPGVKIRGGDRYKLIRVELPFRCPVGTVSGVSSTIAGASALRSGDKQPHIVHAGEWRLAIRSMGQNADTAKVAVLSSSKLHLRIDARVNAGKLTLTAWLERGSKTVVDPGKMIGSLTPHRAATNDSAQQDKLGSRLAKLLKPGQGLNDLIRSGDLEGVRGQPSAWSDRKLMQLMTKFKALIPEPRPSKWRPIMLELRDDGFDGDEKASDGRYTAVVELRGGGQLYGAHIKAYLPSKYGTIGREALTTILVK